MIILITESILLFKAPIVIIAQEGYILSDNVFSTNDEFGDHGYNNSYESMHAIFIGEF